MKKPKWFLQKPASLRETLRMTRLLFLAQIRPLKGNVAAALVFFGAAFAAAALRLVQHWRELVAV